MPLAGFVFPQPRPTWFGVDGGHGPPYRELFALALICVHLRTYCLLQPAVGSGIISMAWQGHCSKHTAQPVQRS